MGHEIYRDQAHNTITHSHSLAASEVSLARGIVYFLYYSPVSVAGDVTRNPQH